MSEIRSLVSVLAGRGQLASDVASALCMLVKRGAELGELETREIPEKGIARTIKTVPAIWIQRLERAVDVGAFDRMTVENIVDRILLPPLPAHEEISAA